MALDTARNIDWKPVWQGFGRAMSVATMFSVYLSGWVAVAAVIVKILREMLALRRDVA